MSDPASKTRRPAGHSAEPPSDHRILGVLLRSSTRVDAPEESDLEWEERRIEPERLRRELRNLAGRRTREQKTRLDGFAADLAGRYRLFVSRADDLDVEWAGQQLRLPRCLVGEALGALGANLFPTRRRARRTALEVARELSYFGYGVLSGQLLPHPVALVRAALAGEEQLYLEPVVLEEVGPGGVRRWNSIELLDLDPYFHRQIDGELALSRFQERLRDDPLDGTCVTMLREFFSRRATVGLRDSARWALGSRHPWFGWQKARELLDGCFERFGTESFLTPRLVLYCPDPALAEDELQRLRANNREVVDELTRRLEAVLPAALQARLEEGVLALVAEAALDIRNDYPDFELEACNHQGGETTARFLGHAAWVLARGLAGREQAPRPNRNLPAHFQAAGLEKRWLGMLDAPATEEFYRNLMEQLDRLERDERPEGLELAAPVYRRIPMVVWTFAATSASTPRKGERLLAEFSLAEARAPQNAQQLRAHPEVFEKLVVFFTLVLRHLLDTDHAPDLRPPRLVRDFMLLGLWGTNTPNLRVRLFENEASGKVRSEVRFAGRAQVKRYRPDEDRAHEAALARLALSQFGPLVEPSLLRALGTFAMAAEERRGGSRIQQIGTVAFLRQSLEVVRETVRTGVKGTLVDLATALEVVVDDSIDLAQRGLDRVERLSAKVRGPAGGS